MAVLDQANAQDAKLRRSLGFWSLVATGVGSVIGSGWLFASQVAAKTAGPAALIAWVIGGLLMLLIALVFAELGIVRPESGGLVRYPLYSNGRFCAGIVGWAMWLAYVANPPTEAAGVVQYANAYLPNLFRDDQLTPLGILIAIALMAVFVVINYLGVRVFAMTNNIATAIKVFIPTITVVLLIMSGFDSDNFTQRSGGFAPYGYGAALGAIATAGLVFAYTGFRNIIELSGEVKNPRKSLPAALVVTILFTIVLYLGLQVAFIGSVPGDKLAGGWSGINFSSPYADLAMLLGITWLYWLLIVDSMVSPSGSAIVFTGANARNIYGLAKNGFFPRWLMKVDDRFRVPTRALLLNFVLGIVFLLPLGSWQKIVAITGTLAVFTFSIGSVSVLAFRRVGIGGRATRLPGMQIIAPAAFVVSSLVIFWVPWSELWKTIPIMVIGILIYLITFIAGKHGRGEIGGGLWLVAQLVMLYVMSFIGDFGGRGWIGHPWGSVIVAAASLALYFWGVSSAVTYLRQRPEHIARVTGADTRQSAPSTG